MMQPTKREQLAAMRHEDFKDHLRTIAGGSSERISAFVFDSGALILSSQNLRSYSQDKRSRAQPNRF
jgi:hypothetical protein